MWDLAYLMFGIVPNTAGGSKRSTLAAFGTGWDVERRGYGTMLPNGGQRSASRGFVQWTLSVGTWGAGLRKATPTADISIRV